MTATTMLTAMDRDGITAAHTRTLEWIRTRRERLRDEIVEAERDLDFAVDNKLHARATERALRYLRKQETFLTKVAGAVEAGYTIIPDLAIDLLAVRTDKDVPGAQSEWAGSASLKVGSARLPAGAGTFVSPSPELESWNVTETNPKGEKKTVTLFRATAHAPVDFPLALAGRPLAERFVQAMRDGIFDEIGLAHDQRHADPVLIGRICHPKSTRYVRRGVAFFIGWYFNLKDLDA